MTESDVATDPIVAPVRRRHRRLRVFGAFLGAFVVAVIAVSVGAVGGASSWEKSYDGKVLPGIRVGTVDLSGLSREQAVAVLLAAYPVDQGRVVLRAPTGDMTIPYSTFGRRLEVDALVDAAMRSGRDGDLATRLPGEIRQALYGASFEPRLVFDAPALRASIGTALAPLTVAPIDALVTMGAKGPLTAPGRAGSDVDPAPVIDAALAAVGPMDAPAEVVVPVEMRTIPPAIDDADVKAAAARADALVGKVKIKYRKKSWTISAATIRSAIRFTPSDDGTVHVTVDPAPITKAAGKAKKAAAKKPRSAFYLKAKGGRVVGVAPGADGRALDAPATAMLVIEELASRLAGAPAATVEVATAPVAPKLTTSDALKKKGVPLLTKLGTWTTWFPISDRNYFGANIWLPAQIINGTMLKPGQRFDWWRAVGPVTPARGFGPGGIIKSDHTEPTGALGGGMCSSSTTLFNAALRAGLQINARSNHKYYIFRYPLGLDATVSKTGNSSQTMSFTNDTKHPILIRGIKTRGGSRGYVTYELWGLPDGRTVSIGRPAVSNVVTASTRFDYVTTLPKGVREQTEYPSNKMDVAVTRIVRNAAGKIIHQEVWRTHYVLWNGIIQVGV